MIVVIKQGGRGKWRWVAYRAVGFGRRVCVAVCPAQGYDSQEQARAAASATLAEIREWADG